MIFPTLSNPFHHGTRRRSSTAPFSRLKTLLYYKAASSIPLLCCASIIFCRAPRWIQPASSSPPPLRSVIRTFLRLMTLSFVPRKICVLRSMLVAPVTSPPARLGLLASLRLERMQQTLHPPPSTGDSIEPTGDSIGAPPRPSAPESFSGRVLFMRGDSAVESRRPPRVAGSRMGISPRLRPQRCHFLPCPRRFIPRSTQPPPSSPPPPPPPPLLLPSLSFFLRGLIFHHAGQRVGGGRYPSRPI